MPAMDQNTCLNYRPVCHLSFHYKTLTRLVAFLFYLPRTSVTSLPIQSGFRAHQSPTIPHRNCSFISFCLRCMYMYLCVVLDHNEIHLSLQVLFDVSSAFYMVDLDIRLQHLQLSSCIFNILWLNHTSQTVFKWLSLVTLDPNGTGLNLVYGVPQGSVLELCSTLFIRLTSLSYL